MQIRRLVPPDAVAYQSLRLHALQNSPTAFGSSYEEECDTPIHLLEAFLGEGSGRVVFGAFIEGRLVGIVGIGRATGRKESHKGFIRSMYVAPSHRGSGIGRGLITAALAFASSLPGLKHVTLAVTAGNAQAVALYESMGFKPFGVEPAALLVDGAFYDELQMIRHLHANSMQVERAAIDDAHAVAEIHVLTWQAAYADIVAPEYLASLSIEKYEKMWRERIATRIPELLVAREYGKVLGWIAFGRSRDEGAAAHEGEIWAMYVSRDSWTRGVGRELWVDAHRRMQERGFKTAIVWAFPENVRAGRFYQAAGFELDPSSEKQFMLGASSMREIRYARAIDSQTYLGV